MRVLCPTQTNLSVAMAHLEPKLLDTESFALTIRSVSLHTNYQSSNNPTQNGHYMDLFCTRS